MSAAPAASGQARIVLIADDFGLSREINQAMLHAYRRGALGGVSLMMGQAATDDAVALARAHPGLEVGWHLHLADSRPLTRAAWPWGRSPTRAGFAIGLSPKYRRVMRDEVHRQWDAFLATGLPCRFVNAHHHLHLHPFVLEVVLDALPAQFDGWLRWGRPRFFSRRASNLFPAALHRTLQRVPRRLLDERRLRTSDTLWGLDRLFAMSAAEITARLPSLGPGVHEFMFHPRVVGDPDSRCLVALHDRVPPAADADHSV